MAINLTRKQFDRWARTHEGRQVRAALYRQQLGLCAYCMQPLPIVETELDHILPLSEGGASDIKNLAISCMPCNRAYGANRKEQLIPWWLEYNG